MEDGAAFYVKQGDAYIIKLVGDIRYTMGCALGDFLAVSYTHLDVYKRQHGHRATCVPHHVETDIGSLQPGGIHHVNAAGRSFRRRRYRPAR